MMDTTTPQHTNSTVFLRNTDTLCHPRGSEFTRHMSVGTVRFFANFILSEWAHSHAPHHTLHLDMALLATAKTSDVVALYTSYGHI
jgi:hypothetical protein